MRRLFVGLLAILLLGLVGTSQAASPAVAFVSAPAQGKVLTATWLLTPPVIDGDLSDWSRFEHHQLNSDTASYPPVGSRPLPNDLSAWISLVWDSDYLIGAISVTDDQVVRNSRNWNFDDMAELSFDNDKNGVFSHRDVRLTLSPDGLVTNNGGMALGVQARVVITPQGWHAEFALPLREFGEDFLNNAEMGFTWGVQDDDGLGVRDRLVWEGTSFTEPTPSQGTLRFVNGPTRQWMILRPGVGGYNGMTDAVLNSWPGKENLNFGNDQTVGLRGDQQWHVMLRFEMPTLPAGARVLDGRLHMTVKSRSNAGTTWARLYRLLRPWNESTVTWFNAETGKAWARGGASLIGTDRSGVVVSQTQLNTEKGEYVWPLGAVVTDMYDHPETNFGFIMRGEQGSNVLYDMYSSECTAVANCTPWIELFVQMPPASALVPALSEVSPQP